MYLISGAAGFLGSYLMESILEKTDENILALSRSKNVFSADNPRVTVLQGDLTDESYLYAVAGRAKIQNLKVIYTAACHNIDYVAAHPDEAYEMNVKIPARLLSMLGKCEKLLFTSSDTVYGEGGNHAFCESDDLQPVSVYGRQKAEAEKVFINNNGTALRLPLMFSRSISPAKKHFCDVMHERLLNNIPVELVTGAVRSTLDYRCVADIITELSLSDNLPDIINIGGDDALSKYDLGMLYAESIGADKSLIIPVESFRAPPAEGAKRADSTILSNSRLKTILGRDKIKITL